MVVTVFDLATTVKRPSKTFAECDTAHSWRFNEAGKVNTFRHCENTYQQVGAYQA